MLTQFIQLELYLILSILSVIVCVGTFLKKEKDVFQAILVNFSIFIVAIVLGTTIKPIGSTHLWLISYIIFGAMLFILITTPVTVKGLLFSNIVVTTIAVYLPLDQIKFAEDSFLSLELILFVITLILYFVLYNQIRVRGDKFQRNIFLVISMGIISAYVFDPIYHLTVMTLLLSVLLWFMIDRVISDNKASEGIILNKLDRLEKEFNDELRREVNKHTFHLKEVQEKMSHINKIDNLTKAYNKKAIFNIIEELTLDRRVDNFTIIMFDLDNFKNLNDTLGHVQGDLCLKTLSSIARDCIRDTDSLGRYGGDEFLIVLPKSSLSTAVTIAERFRDKIDMNTNPHFTVSCGLASYPEDGNTLKDLLDIADKGLYRSKEKGRNAVSYDNPAFEKKY